MSCKFSVIIFVRFDKFLNFGFLINKETIVKEIETGKKYNYLSNDKLTIIPLLRN